MKIKFLAVLSRLVATVLLSGFVAHGALAQTAAASAPASAATGDEALAAKLKGQWTGQWEIGAYNGKFVLVVEKVEGTNLIGEAQWFNTAKGDTKEVLKVATVKEGQLSAEHPDGTKFKLKLQGDNKLEGSWEATGFSGSLTASR